MTDSTDSALDFDEDPLSEAVHEMVDDFEEYAEHDHADEHGHGLTDFEYVKIALFLAVVTAAEVAMSYTIDFWGAFFLPILLAMMFVKFFVVILFFMHLRFDNRLFSIMFYMGMVLDRATGTIVATHVGALTKSQLTAFIDSNV